MKFIIRNGDSMFLIITITVFTMLQITDYILTRMKKNRFKEPNIDDDFASIDQYMDECLTIQEKHEKRNIIYVILLFLVVTSFNFYSFKGGEDMKNEIIVNLKDNFDDFYEEKVKPLEANNEELSNRLILIEKTNKDFKKRITELEDYLFPLGGDPTGPRIGRIEVLEEKVEELENKIIYIERKLKELTIKIAPKLEKEDELDDEKKVTEAIGDLTKIINEMISVKDEYRNINEEIKRLKKISRNQSNDRYMEAGK